MKNSVIYIVGATVLVGGAYLFLKNKKAKDLAKLDEIGGTTTTGGTTSGGTKSGGITPNITEPVKIDKDLNLDAYNLQQLLEQLKNLDNERKNAPKKVNQFGNDKEGWELYIAWYRRIGDPKVYEYRRKPILEKLAKLGYKYDNGLLVKI